MSSEDHFTSASQFQQDYDESMFDAFLFTENSLPDSQTTRPSHSMLSSTPSSESIDSASTDSPARSIQTAASTPPSAHSPRCDDAKLYEVSRQEEARLHPMWNAISEDGNYQMNAGTNDLQMLCPSDPVVTMSPMQMTNSIAPMSIITGNGSISTFGSQDQPNMHDGNLTTLPFQTLVTSYPSGTQATHGQVTPVEEHQRNVPIFNTNVFHQNSFTPANASRTSPPNSRGSSQAPMKQTQTTTSKRSKKTTKTAREADEQQEAKRKRFLERNRVAASKCRQKKKEWMATLEESARNVQTTNKLLSHTVSVLREELLILKGELLKHHGCECPQISAFLEHEADRVSQVQHRRASIPDKTLPPLLTDKSRQLSIAESEMTEMSAMDFEDDIDILNEDHGRFIDQQQQQDMLLQQPMEG